MLIFQIKNPTRTGCQGQGGDGEMQRLGALLVENYWRLVVELGDGAVVVQVAQRVHRLPQDGPHPEAQARRDAMHQSKPRQFGAVINYYLNKPPKISQVFIYREN